jgi:DNA-binding MarR family transcriptional regulator
LVKKIDDIETLLPDHIGWALWQAAQAWKQRFERAMVAAGYPWFFEARAAVLAHLDLEGTRQSVLTARMGISKQAVQQLVDELVVEAIVIRAPDPADARGKLIHYTDQGIALLRVANRIKVEIEAEYRATLGEESFRQFRAALDRLNRADGPPPKAPPAP